MLKHNSCVSRWFLTYVEKKQERAILQRGHLSNAKILLFKTPTYYQGAYFKVKIKRYECY